MKSASVFIVAALVAIAGWWFVSQPQAGSAVTALPGAESSLSATLTLSPAHPTAGEQTQLTFTFTNASGTPVTDLMTHHGRKVHVMIVSEDRNVLGHIHPMDFPELNQGDAPGTYVVSFPFPKSGRYLVATDVMNIADSLSRQFVVQVGGSPAIGTQAVDTATDKCFSGYPQDGADRYVKPVLMSETVVSCPQGYEVSFSHDPIITGKPAQLNFTVKKDGKPVTDLSPVMEAAVHFGIVPDSFDSLMHRHGEPGTTVVDDHAHSDTASVDGMTHAALPERFGPLLSSEPIVFAKPGTYTLFMEFKRGTELVFGTFSFEVTGAPAATGDTKMFMLSINGKKLTGPDTWSVKEGDTVMFHVMSDAPEEVHVHGYNKSVEFEAGKEATLTFFADTAGRFPVELENSKTDIGVLEVLPK